MTKHLITAGALSLAVFTACSEDSTAGNAVEPNGFAEISSSATAIPEDVYSSSSNEGTGDTLLPPNIGLIDLDEIYTFTTAVTSEKKYGLALVSAYQEENAASGNCSVKGQELTGVVKIKDDLVTRAYSGKNLKVNIDNLVYMLQKTCAQVYDDVDKVVDSLSIRKDGFDMVCITESDYMSIDDALGRFGDIMSLSCRTLEIQARLDSLDSASAANTLPIINFPEEDPSEIVVDTTSRTLAAYTSQYARPEDLSFDPHVMAYNSNLSTECFKAMGRFKETDISISFETAPIMSIEREAIPTCFPATDSVGHFSKKDASCKYYLIESDDGAQPTGHVLSKVSSDAIETIGISPGGTCMQTCAYFQVYFLVEDCEEIINENTVVKARGAKSSRWSCEEGKYSPSFNAIPYGEWYSESLL